MAKITVADFNQQGSTTARIDIRPMPGNENTLSVIMAPPKRPAKSRPAIVTMGISA